MNSDIVKLLSNGLVSLSSDCLDCINVLERRTFRLDQIQKQFVSWLNLLKTAYLQIKIHTNLYDDQLVDVNLASDILLQFVDKKKTSKVVHFYIKKGFDGKRLSEKDEPNIRDEFIIKKCLPIMHLVPMQLASNAKKYMPKNSSLDVELTQTELRNVITLKNVGPLCDSNEIELITESRVRGINAQDVIGMGIGLSEVEDILNIHYPWLSTTIDVDSESEPIIFNGRPHSTFTVIISYLNSPSFDSIQHNINNFKQMEDILLLHNSIDIVGNLMEVCDKILCINERNTDKSWQDSVYKLRLGVSSMQDIIKFCLYKNDKPPIDELLGKDDVSLDVQKLFVAILMELRKYYKKNVNLDFQGQLHKRYTRYSCRDGFRTIVFGLCSLVVECLTKLSTLEINFQEDEIMFKCDDDLNFKKTIQSLENNDVANLASERFSMYQFLLKELNIDLRTNTNKLFIGLPKY